MVISILSIRCVLSNCKVLLNRPHSKLGQHCVVRKQCRLNQPFLRFSNGRDHLKSYYLETIQNPTFKMSGFQMVGFRIPTVLGSSLYFKIIFFSDIPNPWRPLTNSLVNFAICSTCWPITSSRTMSSPLPSSTTELTSA